MKTNLITLFFLMSGLAHAALPVAGEYSCRGERAFNMPPTTVDQLKLQYWESQRGNPVVRLSTSDQTVSSLPSLFGGESSTLLEPQKPEDCKSGFASSQVVNCAQALLPPIKNSENLFVKQGAQYVYSVQISGNFTPYVSHSKNKNLAILVEFRKNSSHWSRIYNCQLLK